MRLKFFYTVAVCLAAMLALVLSAGCGEEQKAQPTAKKTGISGTVKYTGASTGGIFIYASDQLPKPAEAPQPAATNQFNGSAGDFSWELAPGTWYIIAFFTIDRPPQGPTLPNEPLVTCDAITVKEGEVTSAEILLTDADAGGKTRSCLKR